MLVYREAQSVPVENNWVVSIVCDFSSVLNVNYDDIDTITANIITVKIDDYYNMNNCNENYINDNDNNY